MPSGEFAVRVLFRHDDEGRCYIESPDLIGLHLAGSDLDAMRRELDTIIKDLVWFNHDRVIDKIRWIPSLDEVAAKFKAATERNLTAEHTEVCVINLRNAA